MARKILNELACALHLPAGIADRAQFHGGERLPSSFPVTELAAASIASAGLALADLLGLIDETPSIVVDNRLASLWFGFSIQPQGWTIPAAWDPLAGDYETRDGWIKLHTNALHHRNAAMHVLGCSETRDAVAKAVRRCDADELEASVIAEGGCAAALHSREKWLDHPQGCAIVREPLILWDMSEAAPPFQWTPTKERSLAGLRVLDLTRVLAGPVATRFLAGYGAQVLRIDPPGWFEPGVVSEVTVGKRCARLDLRQPEERRVFEQLLSTADILVHGYRSDALERLGLGADARQAIRPGLIDVSLNAYGHSGPWANRRGFDSLVQFSSGIAAAGMIWQQTAEPVSLPVQALDQATGYLMAAAAVRGIAARLRNEPLGLARLSLARTADLLWAYESERVSGMRGVRSDDLSDDVEETEWGRAKRLKSPMHLTGCAMRWERPATSLGTSKAEWL